MAKISVIIPVYNVEKYLEECLKSITNQTFKDIEIICVDDGSTDHSLDILNKFALYDSRFKIIHQKNKGAGAARNRGMEIAGGEFLYFIDSDDFADLKILEKMYYEITMAGSDICVCKNFYKNTNINHKNPLSKNDRFSLLFKFFKDIHHKNNKYRIFNRYNSADNLFQICNIPPYTKLYRHSFIKQNRIKFQEIKTCNDVFFNFFSIACANSITIINEKLVVHRIGHESISKNRAKSIECVILAFSELKKHLINAGIFNDLNKAYYKRAEKCFKYELEQVENKKDAEYWKNRFSQFLQTEYNDLILHRG